MSQSVPAEQKVPIETLSPEKLYWLRKWVGKQPHGSSMLRDLSEEQLKCWLCCALTLADWLLPHREKLLKKAKPRVVLIGAGPETEAANQGQDLRYVAPLLGLPRLDFHLVGRECLNGMMQSGTADYPSQVRGYRNNWNEVEEREIAEGMDAAFLFHPGLHCTPDHLLPYLPKERGSDMLETGCLKAIVRAKLPLGMSSFNLKDGKRDCEKLVTYGFTTANFRENRWGIKDTKPSIRQDTGQVSRDDEGEILYNSNSLYVVDVVGLESEGVRDASKC